MTLPAPVLCLFAWLLCMPAAQAEPTIEVRDAQTGAFLASTLLIERADARRETHRLGVSPARRGLGPDLRLLQFTADGYRPLQMLPPHPSTEALQIWLLPEHARDYPVPEGPEQAAIEGFVYLRAAAQPVAGAEVRLGQARTTSDAAGRFELHVRVDEGAREAGQPEVLEVSDAGLRTQRSLRLVPGAHRLIVDLDASAPDLIDHRHDGRVLQSTLPPDADVAVALDAPVLQPPATLRVGFADAGFSTPCCVGSCAAVAVMALETYVKRGLNDEWIASWRPDALRAGAIAYRSYGAWHVEHPRSTSYDVCSSACCQVNDADTSASTDAAVDATAGILLERGGIFRSEYSAENNGWDDPADGLSCSNADLSCGDGFVGSPAAGWPCLADAVASGHGCFGHGRGMSQWGSQRWADTQARRWPWIVDHYYNALGAGGGQRTAVISSPLRIDAVTPLPAQATPGTRIALRYELANLAGQTHPAVFLGASLYRADLGYVDDPVHDIGIALAAGSSPHVRDFDLPAGIAPGSWDVLVALYLDVDGNGSINSGDFPLVSRLAPDALTVTASGQTIFADGFE